MRAAVRAGIRRNRTVGATALGYAAEVLADSPGGYWRMGESSGTTMVDSSGNSHDGTYGFLGNYPTLGTAGLVVGSTDTCATFHGDTLGGVNYGSWMNTSAVTVEALIRTTGSGIAGILNRDGLSDRVFQFRMTAAGKVEFILIGTSTVFCTGTTSVNDGAAHHVAATYDSATIKVYVDGVLDASTTTSVALPSNTQVITLGKAGDSVSQFFDGDLDEAAYYTTALSAARIAAHAAAAANTIPLTLYYQTTPAQTGFSGINTGAIPAEVEVSFGNLQTGNLDYLQLFGDGSSSNAYTFRLQNGVLEKNGSTVLTTGVVVTSNGENATVRLRYVSGTIKIYKNDLVIGSYTDSSPLTQTNYVGVGNNTSFTSVGTLYARRATTLLAFDNFSGSGQLSGSGTTLGSKTWSLGYVSGLVASDVTRSGGFAVNSGSGEGVETVNLGVTTYRVSGVLATGGTHTSGVVWRYVDANNFFAAVQSGSVYNIVKVVGGVSTTIGTMGSSSTVPTSLEVSVTPSGFNWHFNGNPIPAGSATDPTHSSAIRAGVYVAHNIATLDAFLVTTGPEAYTVPTYSLVQSTQGDINTGSSTATFATPSNAGNTLVAAIYSRSSAPDAPPAGWTQIGSVGSGEEWATLWYRPNAPATTSLTASIFVFASCQVQLMEFTGFISAPTAASVGSFNGIGSNGQTITASSAPSGNGLVFAVSAARFGGTNYPATGYTNVGGTGYRNGRVDIKRIYSGMTETVTWTHDTPGETVSLLLAEITG